MKKKLTRKEALEATDKALAIMAEIQNLQKHPRKWKAFEREWEKRHPRADVERYRVTLIFDHGKMHSVEEIKLNDDQEAMLNILTSSMHRHIDSAPKEFREALQSRIRGLLCHYKLGNIKGHEIYERVESDLKSCLKSIKKGAADISPDQIRSLVSMPRLTKLQVCQLFGIDPKRPRTLQRYIKDGYRGYYGGKTIKLKRQGTNGSFLIEDIRDFIQQTDKHSDLLQYFLNRSKKER